MKSWGHMAKANGPWGGEVSYVMPPYLRLCGLYHIDSNFQFIIFLKKNCFKLLFILYNFLKNIYIFFIHLGEILFRLKFIINLKYK